MNRVRKLFRRLKDEHRCGLIAYITCGDGPTIEIIRALEDAGADAIELGVPFSDPIADGPVIQAAAHRALQNGTRISDIFTIARAVRKRSEIPLIAFSYFNPVLRHGIAKFADDAHAAGIDSVLLTDLPAEAAGEVKPAFKKQGLGSIFLLAPTSSDARIAAVNRVSDDFIYYVSTMGVTGARSELDPALLTRLDEVRARVTKPLAVGFGISKHAHYELLMDRCDAIVVGSAIVRAVADGDASGAPERVASVVREILTSR
ncbi:MAG TPA: tryptophan synthase subunit alpha [Thermoanaerobaculia bacterium]|jgi:tryptophan synthase alpha chain|nr:tryptophan synthase subunit alpha [Thermoanaerobaculia bacterium]